MLEQLFGSKTRFKVLKIFYRNAKKAFFVRELARSAEVQINAVRRELELLSKIGLVSVVDKKDVSVDKNDLKSGGSNLRKYFKLNKDCIIYSELQALLLKENLLGEQKFVKEIQNKGGDIKLFLLSGKFTSDKKAPTDILLVGDLKERVLNRVIANYEKEFGSPLRFTTMTEREFTDRRYVMDKFLFTVFESNNLKIINEFDI